MSGTSVFLLYHTHVLEDDREDVKLIGVFSTEAAARSAQSDVSSAPGFRDVPEGFMIDEYRIDELCWRDGYIEMGSISE